MSNPVFLVDGYTEKLIIGRICPGKPVKRIDLNGNSVTITAIAKKVSSIITLLNNVYYPIIIVIDREDRENDCESIIDELRGELISRGHATDDIRISVADRMLENWIIADWSLISDKIEKPENTDGLKGATVIKKHKGSYSKTTDGVELFNRANPHILYNNSLSYKKFIDSLDDLDCYYKDRCFPDSIV